MENFMDTLATSVRDAVGPFMAAIPKILGFIVILVIGWVIAALIARGVAAILRTVKFDDLARRFGFSDLVERMGLKGDAAGFIGMITKWFIRIIIDYSNKLWNISQPYVRCSPGKAVQHRRLPTRGRDVLNP
ncbi:MAG: hypothetical protein HY308_14300 [Gammaproteobacteria bacterium]|nr:hypothetical protein [Gammaproteobacteria bacterium]